MRTGLYTAGALLTGLLLLLLPGGELHAFQTGPGSDTGAPAPPVYSHTAGFYTQPVTLELSHPDPDVTIFYTLDGSDPSPESIPYSNPVTLHDRSSEPNRFSMIPTNSGDDRPWREPDGLVSKATVVRAVAVRDSLVSAAAARTYFVFPEGGGRHNLPVISLTADSLDYFGHERGIYVPGAHYTGASNSGNYRQRGEEWERETFFEFFETDGSYRFSQTVGARIHGGFTRRFPQKSLRIYTRSDYGESRLNYAIFPESEDTRYNRLILRNSGNDYGLTLFRDAAAQSLVRHFDLDTQAYRPSIVYLNGEYWGIHNIRERLDRHYLERTYGIDPDNIDLLSTHNDVQEGDDVHYLAMYNYIDLHDLAEQERFDYVATQMDLNNFLDYYSAQIYLGNNDWPQNNIDFWRLRTPYDPEAPAGHDGRWRWLLYDADRSFGFVSGTDFNMIEWVTRHTWATTILRNLLRNESFKHQFINRIADHLNSAFLPGRVNSMIDSLRAPLAPEIEEHGRRWEHPPSLAAWESHINEMRTFAEERPGILRSHVMDHFGISSTETVTVGSYDYSRGQIFVNSLAIDPATPGVGPGPFPWTGSYFRGIPVTLTARARPGYIFSHWEIGGEVFPDEQITLLPEEMGTVTAHFEETSLDILTPHPLAESPWHFTGWEADATPATTPPSMAFVYMNEEEPGLEAEVAGLTRGRYDHDSRTRVNGLGEDGFAFINTGNPDGNPGYPGTRLGGAVLALDTRGTERVWVGWRGGTLEPNSRIYHLRLRYRTSRDEPFRDLPGPDGEPVEYLRNEEAGHSEFLGPAELPEDAMGSARIELLWQYYFSGERVTDESGQRSRLRVADIHVTALPAAPWPPAHPLTESDYLFSGWPADTTAGAAPPSMEFVYMSGNDPGLQEVPIGFTSGSFDLDSRSRINGLGEDGFSFINTANREGNPGYPGTRLGGALLAINTERRADVAVEWTAGTLEPNSRIYHLRLQYRISPLEPFRDVLGPDGAPVEYFRSSEAGHTETLGPVLLPPDAENRERVELLWRYYYSGDRVSEESGERSRLHISQIRVTSLALMGGTPGPPGEFSLWQNYPNPFRGLTTIRFDLPEPQHVTLEIFTITGQRLMRLTDREYPQGRHAVEFDASSLASGVYLYHLYTDDYSETGKLTVIR